MTRYDIDDFAGRYAKPETTGDYMNEKDSIPGKLWDVVTTLSESVQQAGIRKAQDLGIDLDAGQIPFQETLVNLSHNRDVLRDAIERGRIVQLPLKLQYRLLAETTKVKTQLDALVGGGDAVLPLEAAVEDLSATIWQFNLQNLSDQVLSFESKMNELKSQEVQIKKVLNESRKLEKAIARLQEIQEQAESLVGKTIGSANQADVEVARLGTLAQKIEDAERATLASSSLVKDYETDIAQAAAATRNSHAEIVEAEDTAKEALKEIDAVRDSYFALKEQAETLIEETNETIASSTTKFDNASIKLRASLQEDVETFVETYTKRLDDSLEEVDSKLTDALDEASASVTTLEETTSASEAARVKKADALLAENRDNFIAAKDEILADFKANFEELEATSEANIDRHNQSAKTLTDELAELEGRIRTSIERATGYTLFHSFQKRQQDLQRSKLWWIGGLLVCIGVSVCLSWFFIHSLGGMHEVNALFFMKLSISLPLIFAITFCSVQYSKERRLEEEYAFKSNISISLEPYQKLVSGLIDEDNSEEKAKYTAFIIASINKVFTSPTGLVFDTEEKDGTTANNLLKTAGNVAETLVKLKTK